MTADNKYTCNEYREEMMLLGLRRRLNAEDVPEDERQRLEERIKDLEVSMGMQ